MEHVETADGNTTALVDLDTVNDRLAKFDRERVIAIKPHTTASTGLDQRYLSLSGELADSPLETLLKEVGDTRPSSTPHEAASPAQDTDADPEQLDELGDPVARTDHSIALRQITKLRLAWHIANSHSSSYQDVLNEMADEHGIPPYEEMRE